MNIVQKPLSEITPYAKNAKKHDKTQIANVAESIKQYGFVQPIVIDRDGVIVIGHCRALAAKKLGMKTVPCVCVDDLTPEQVNALRLVDNKSNESDWDFDLLKDELPELDLSAFDFDWGISDDITEEVEEDEALEVDEVSDPVTKRGDIWQLGRHRLMCGDSTDKTTVELLMDGNKADICITSPPYGAGDNAHLRKKLSVGYSGRDGKTFYNQYKDNKSDWPLLMKSFFDVAQCFSLSQFVNVMMIGDNKKPLIEWLYNNLQFLVDIICWNKHTCPPQIHENVLNNGYEFVFVFDNENGTRKIRFGDFRGSKSNFIETKKQQNEYADIHKAVFGTEFVKTILDINGKAQSVYEPFGGTGTTMIVCEQLNRTCYMMELDPKYCDVIIKRWETQTGKKAVILNDG
jgi:site-specific DNA-methyltransferase (adenine-specific)